MGGTLSKIWTHETSISLRYGQKKSCMFFMQERAKLLFETLRPLSILLSCLGSGQFFTSPLAQNRAISDRNQRDSAPKMRANARKAHSKIARRPHIISSTSKITSACVAHSQRACNVPKLCKNRREHVRFSCNFL